MVLTVVILLLGAVLNHADTSKQGSPIAVIYRLLGFTFSTFSWQETLVLVIASKDSWEIHCSMLFFLRCMAFTHN